MRRFACLLEEDATAVVMEWNQQEKESCHRHISSVVCSN